MNKKDVSSEQRALLWFEGELVRIAKLTKASPNDARVSIQKALDRMTTYVSRASSKLKSDELLAPLEVAKAKIADPKNDVVQALIDIADLTERTHNRAQIKAKSSGFHFKIFGGPKNRPGGSLRSALLS
ncbi:MAG: hypothetical protein AAF720_00780 [Pseudomonadota bacterium]